MVVEENNLTPWSDLEAGVDDYSLDFIDQLTTLMLLIFGGIVVFSEKNTQTLLIEGAAVVVRRSIKSRL